MYVIINESGKRGDRLSDIDELLINKIKAGDLNSFETLVSRYQRKIFSFIYRMVTSEEDARDLSQEVFLQVFRSLDRYRGEAKFSTWLYRVAANKSLDFLRQNKKTRPFEIDRLTAVDIQNAGPVADSPESIYLREEKIRRLRRMISGLPDRYRVILILFHYENLSYREIAELLDIPVKTVATRLYRAKLILKERLKLIENSGGEKDAVP